MLFLPKNSKRRAPLDLHVLGTPPAFILSQDQTLVNNIHPCIYARPDPLSLVAGTGKLLAFLFRLTVLRSSMMLHKPHGAVLL